MPSRVAADLSTILGPCLGTNPETSNDSGLMQAQQRLCDIFKVFRLMSPKSVHVSVRVLCTHRLWAGRVRYLGIHRPLPGRQ